MLLKEFISIIDRLAILLFIPHQRTNFVRPTIGRSYIRAACHEVGYAIVCLREVYYCIAESRSAVIQRNKISVRVSYLRVCEVVLLLSGQLDSIRVNTRLYSGNLSYVVHCAFRINEIVHLMLLDIVLCGIVVKHTNDIALIGEQQFTILVQNLNSLLRSIGLMQSGLRIVGQSVEYIKVEDQLVVVWISRELIERREIAFCEIIGNIVVHSLIRILRLLYIIIEFKGAVAGFGFCSDQG